MKEYSLSQAPYTLTLTADFMGKDLLLRLTGGEAHIGAVALATPRPSRRHPDRTSADASVLCVSGHKEDLLTREIALRVSAALGVTVCVVSGIHFAALDETQMDTVLLLAHGLTDTLLASPPQAPTTAAAPHAHNAAAKA